MTRVPGEAGLVRALGVWGLAASIVNITIGGGIFRAPGTVEVTGRLGAAAPLAYAVCALAMTFVVLCFAEAGSRVALTGGPYAYVERAFGGFAGCSGSRGRSRRRRWRRFSRTVCSECCPPIRPRTAVPLSS
jgi:amino acid transporter